MSRFRQTVAFLVMLLAIPFFASAVRDGNGGYSLPSNQFSEPVPGGTLTATDAIAVWNDIEQAIAGSLAADGQTTMTGNLKAGGNKITGLTSGSARTDSITLGQVQDNAVRFGGVAGGTADALTLALSPVVTAYTNGMTIYFVSSASPNTGAATVNVNSVATDAILLNGAALVAGDIAASKVYAITYYNSDWHLWSPTPKSTLGVHKLWVPAAAMRPQTGSPPSSADNTISNIQVYSLDYDQSGTECAFFNISMPSSADETAAITFLPVWTAASGSGNVVFRMYAWAVGNDDTLSVAFGTLTDVTDTLIATNDLHRGPESAALTINGTWAANDLLVFVLCRAGGDGGDTLNADAKVLGVDMFFTTNAATDAPRRRRNRKPANDNGRSRRRRDYPVRRAA